MLVKSFFGVIPVPARASARENGNPDMIGNRKRQDVWTAPFGALFAIRRTDPWLPTGEKPN